jgi:ParB-like chromosome segregation protein Spo0J
MNYLNIQKISPDKNQPRKTFENLDELAMSLKEDGFLYPIVIDDDNTIIDGERRYRAAQKAGLKEVPVIQVDVESKKQRLIKQLIADTHHQKLPLLERDKAWKKLYEELGHPELKAFSDVLNAPYTRVIDWNARVNLDAVYEDLDPKTRKSDRLKGYIVDETRTLRNDPELRAKVIKKIHDDDIRSRDGLRTFVREVKEAAPEERESLLKTEQDKWLTAYNYTRGAVRVLMSNLNNELWHNLPDAQKLKLSGDIDELRKHLARWKAYDSEVLDE